MPQAGTRHQPRPDCARYALIRVEEERTIRAAKLLRLKKLNELAKAKRKADEMMGVSPLETALADALEQADPLSVGWQPGDEEEELAEPELE